MVGVLERVGPGRAQLREGGSKRSLDTRPRTSDKDVKDTGQRGRGGGVGGLRGKEGNIVYHRLWVI